jgi:2-oxoisovalerate dehydrogenase E2 component (dihydrolipoyl transacylase)
VSNVKEFRLPDVGEGLTEAEIVSWKVKAGDTVAVNDVIVEIETAKSLVELPCPYAGRVERLLVDEGVTVDVGTPIIAVDTAPAGAASVDGSPGSEGSGDAAREDQRSDVGMRDDMVPAIPTPSDDEAVEPGLIGGPAPGGRTSVLVGYGPRAVSAVRRARKGRAGAGTTAAAVNTAFSVAGTEPVPAAPQPLDPADAPVVARPMAKPPVRKLAKDLGVDLATVTPSDPSGIVSRADVEAAARGGAAQAATAASQPSAVTAGFDPATRERRIPIKGVRKATAQAMVRSAFTAPHVTEFVSVDVTRTIKLIERMKASREFEGVRVGPLLLIARALLLAVRRHPGMNASWDEAAGEIVVKDYVNLGIAAATPRGLLVPNIKDAGRLSLVELSKALSDLTATARAGKTSPSDMAGGTMTITNVGVFGVDTGTPILNPGESAILAVGSIKPMPWVHKGKIKPRQVLQLGLSFDHRMIDGELGSLFLGDLARLLEHPDTALLWA